MKSNLRNEIKSYIVRQGMTMQEVVDLLHDEHGWSDSVSNLSNKLQRESLRYVEAVQLADALGYEIVWQKRRYADLLLSALSYSQRQISYSEITRRLEAGAGVLHQSGAADQGKEQGTQITGCREKGIAMRTISPAKSMIADLKSCPPTMKMSKQS